MELISLLIEDILRYTVIERPKRKVDDKIPSLLEIITKEKKVEESIEEAIDKQKVTFDMEIPVKKVDIPGFEIKYKVREEKETLEMSIGGISLKSEKESKEKEYSISFVYDKEQESYRISYSADYSGRMDIARQDFTNRLDKFMDTLPKSVMGGVLGFTYLGSGKMTLRDDLIGATRQMVQVHEAIHTPDEYETRVLTDWIITLDKPKYKKG